MFPSPGDILDPGIEPRSPALQADSLPSEPPGREGEVWAFCPLALSLRVVPEMSMSLTLLSFCNPLLLFPQTPLLKTLGVTPCDFSLPCLHLKKVFIWLISLVVAHGLSCPAPCGILVPKPGMEPESPALEGRFLTTGLPGKSWDFSKPA